MHPIYMIVYENCWDDTILSMWGLPAPILAVIEGDVSDIQAMWDKYVAPLQNQGRLLRTLYLSREPDSFLREKITHE